ncbi:PREDICTED: solute carrier family 2, facilitated glucose transporter member 12-like [Branchiostoma belcheri]|uniref:Solute carrier family 2, facilitated glucose transporter member 12-like n=1 Tax=Branchiostoma belcheri TaxID=7741 RepID=A0A6P4YLU6_BRABE|nr:PREDICTED: solute carrier family 2, facilitated glucose transporter member 12-like [Branchiostoma belcheri]
MESQESSLVESSIQGLLSDMDTTEDKDGEAIEMEELQHRQENRTYDGITTGYVLLASVMAALGGVLFGYDIGIVSGALLQLREELQLGCFQQEMVVSSMLMGAVIGSLTGGFIVDRFGRRSAIIVNAGVFVCGAMTLALAQSYAVLVTGRLVVGFAVSLSAIAECIYISEIAPSSKRGMLVSLNELGITLGILVAYLVNFLFISVPNGWRWMFGLSSLPAIAQGLGMVFLPPSPRYLIINRQEEKAQQVLRQLRGSSVDVELNNIKNSLQTEQKFGVFDLFRTAGNMRGRMVIGTGIVFFQQFTGQPNVLYYAPTIFQLVGFQSNTAATLATVGLGIVKVLSTIVSLCLVDRFGRRKFLLAGATVMAVSILILGVITHSFPASEFKRPCESGNDTLPGSTHTRDVIFPATLFEPTLRYGNTVTSPVTVRGIRQKSKKNFIWTSGVDLMSGSGAQLIRRVLRKHPNAVSSVEFVGNETEDGTELEVMVPDSAKGISLLTLMVFVAAYAFGFGPVSWLVLSEIFPVNVKGRAVALTTVLNWGTNLVISLSFLNLVESVGISVVCQGYAVMGVIAAVFILLVVPETKNRTLEQISHDLETRSVCGRLNQWLACCRGGLSRRRHASVRIEDSVYSPIHREPMHL